MAQSSVIEKARNARFNQIRRHIHLVRGVLAEIEDDTPQGASSAGIVTDGQVAELRDALTDALAAFHEFNAHRNDANNLAGVRTATPHDSLES